MEREEEVCGWKGAWGSPGCLASCQRSGPEAAFLWQTEPLDPAQMFPVGRGRWLLQKEQGKADNSAFFLEVWHHQDSVKPTQTQTRPGNWTRLSPCLLAAFSSLTHTATSLVSYLRISQIAFFHWLPFPNVLSHCSVAGPESQMRCWHTKTVPVYKHVLPRLAAHPQKTAAKNLTLLLLILFLFFQI